MATYYNFHYYILIIYMQEMFYIKLSVCPNEIAFIMYFPQLLYSENRKGLPLLSVQRDR